MKAKSVIRSPLLLSFVTGMSQLRTTLVRMFAHVAGMTKFMYEFARPDFEKIAGEIKFDGRVYDFETKDI